MQKNVIWDEWTLGDYRIVKQLYDKIPNKLYIDEVLSKVQRRKANGLGQRNNL